MVSETTKTAVKGGAKAGGGILGISAAADVIEGSGFDKLRGAAAEAVNGLEVAARMAGGVLQDIFGGLPWQMGGNTSEAAPGIVSFGIDAVVAVV